MKAWQGHRLPNQPNRRSRSTTMT